MNENQIAEVLFLINKIEFLMEKNGAVGQSFSDKVKSFDTFRERVDYRHLAYKFYYNKDLDEYEYKHNQVDKNYEDLWNYRKYQNYRKEYFEYKNNLLDGYWNNLKSIGHERNQVMHIDGYKIPNYKQYIIACNEVIEYFNGIRTSPPSFSLNKEPLVNKIFFKFILLADVLAISILSVFIYTLVIVLVDNLNYEIKVMTSFCLLSILGNLFFKYPKKFITKIKKTLKLIIKVPMRILKRESRRFFRHPIQSLFMWCVLYMIFIMFVSQSVDNGSYIPFIVFIYLFYKYPKIFRKLSGYIYKNLLLTFLVLMLVPNIVSNIFSKNSKTQNTIKNECNYQYVSAKKLNIREDSNRNSKKIGSLLKNDSVCIEKESLGWSYIKDKGWVSSKYLSKYFVD